jgi:hypothetical protein
MASAYPAATDTGKADTAEMFAASIVISLEEHLPAAGYGIADAVRQPADGLVWLNWKHTKPSR